MTIKKPMKAPVAAGASAAPAVGGATIADRFKLDAPDPNQKPVATAGTKYAVIAGFIALVVAGVLTYVLWQHWEFLMPA